MPVQILEKEKQWNLSKQQHKTSTPIPDAPGWNEHLASASEASVKARRSPSHLTPYLSAHTTREFHIGRSALEQPARAAGPNRSIHQKPAPRGDRRADEQEPGAERARGVDTVDET